MLGLTCAASILSPFVPEHARAAPSSSGGKAKTVISSSGPGRSDSLAAPAQKAPFKKKEGFVYVLIESNKGNIKLELDPKSAPVTVENFVDYVKSGHFDGTIFHRVIGGFMIQGGGFDVNMKQKATRKAIAIESSNGLKNDRGSIAMARTSDPNSATSQFFINLSDNAFLNFESSSKPGYAVFGKVVEGMDVVDDIAKVRTGNSGMHADVPVQPVVIEKATIVD